VGLARRRAVRARSYLVGGNGFRSAAAKNPATVP
jgi:hypothetical protein